MQITSLDFSSFKGRIAIGRVFRGDLEKGKDYMLCKDGVNKKVVSKSYLYLKVWVEQRLIRYVVVTFVQ